MNTDSKQKGGGDPKSFVKVWAPIFRKKILFYFTFLAQHSCKSKAKKNTQTKK